MEKIVRDIKLTCFSMLSLSIAELALPKPKLCGISGFLLFFNQYGRKRCVRKLFAATLFFVSFSTIGLGKTVTIATLEWEPYVGQKLEGNGVAAEVVRQALAAVGHKTEFKFYPWKRVLEKARRGEVDGGFPAYDSLERQRDYWVSDPMLQSKLGFLARKKDNVKWSKLEDLKGKSIGVVLGYVNTSAFDKASFLTKRISPTDQKNVLLLVRERLDLVVIDRFVGLNY